MKVTIEIQLAVSARTPFTNMGVFTGGSTRGSQLE